MKVSEGTYCQLTTSIKYNAGVTSPGRRPGHWNGGTRMTSNQDPLLSAPARSNGKDKPMQLVPGWLQELQNGFVLQNQPPIGLHSRFSAGVYSPAFAIPMISAAKAFRQTFPTLHEAGSPGLHSTCGRSWTRPDPIVYSSPHTTKPFQTL